MYDPTLGAFGDALDARARVASGGCQCRRRAAGRRRRHRASTSVRRSAALMDHDGVVPDGRVGDELLVRDPAAPFGLRLDATAVVRGVPASVAAAERRPRGSLRPAARRSLRRVHHSRPAPRAQGAALRDTDALVGRMLADVDFSRDAVVVVGPAASRRGSGLTVAAIRAPDVSPGLLRSATSRRTGFVYVADVAPTVLDLFGVSTPDDMEGRVMQVRAHRHDGQRAHRLPDRCEPGRSVPRRTSQRRVHGGARPRGAARARDRVHARSWAPQRASRAVGRSRGARLSRRHLPRRSR